MKYLMSDSSPLFQFLYHFVPGGKSFSEVHDMQMKQLEEKNGGTLPQWVNVFSIPPSFMKTFTHAVGQALDVPNWGTNYRKFIKPSFEIRQPPKQ